MNKGWPSLLWFLWNSDGDQAGGYFGAQEANRTLHALYALDNGTVTLDNLGNTTQSGLSVEATVYNLAGAVLDDRTASSITLNSQQVLTGVLTRRCPPPVRKRTSWNCSSSRTGRSWTGTSTGCPPSRTPRTGPSRSASPPA
jgi:hypothetical protein